MLETDRYSTAIEAEAAAARELLEPTKLSILTSQDVESCRLLLAVCGLRLEAHRLKKKLAAPDIHVPPSRRHIELWESLQRAATCLAPLLFEDERIYLMERVREGVTAAKASRLNWLEESAREHPMSSTIKSASPPNVELLELREWARFKTELTIEEVISWAWIDHAQFMAIRGMALKSDRLASAVEGEVRSEPVSVAIELRQSATENGHETTTQGAQHATSMVDLWEPIPPKGPGNYNEQLYKYLLRQDRRQRVTVEKLVSDWRRSPPEGIEVDPEKLVIYYHTATERKPVDKGNISAAIRRLTRNITD